MSVTLTEEEYKEYFSMCSQNLVVVFILFVKAVSCCPSFSLVYKKIGPRSTFFYLGNWWKYCKIQSTPKSRKKLSYFNCSSGHIFALNYCIKCVLKGLMFEDSLCDP